MSYYTKPMNNRNSTEWQMGNFRVPKEIDKLTLADFEGTPYLQVASDWLNEFPAKVGPKGLYVYGSQSGTGKSSFCSMLCRELIKRGKTRYNCCFLPADDLFEKLRAICLDHNSPGLTQTQWFHSLMQMDVIIFDDLGVERMSSFIVTKYMQLMTALWGEDRVIMVTSKFELGDLLNRADADVDRCILESIGSRMQAMVAGVHFDKIRADHRLTNGPVKLI